MLAEVSLLTAGLQGAVVISVFSTILDGSSGFIAPRTLPATAVLFSEPDITVPGTTISRSSTSERSHSSCSRPIIPIGRTINTLTNSAQSFSTWLLRNALPPALRPKADTALNRWSTVPDMLSLYKSRAWEKLGLRCLIPRLRRPFEPIFEHIRCKLGISKDQYMEAPVCNRTICSTTALEDREITMSKPIPSMIDMSLAVQTIDDCFSEMTKLVFGARILIKIVDDQDCKDPRYENICNDLFQDNMVIDEEDCSSPR